MTKETEPQFLLSDFLISTELRMELLTSSEVIQPAADAICTLFSGFFVCQDCRRVSVALAEVLRNAVEHGNLDISYEEKSAALEADSFEQLLDERTKIAQREGKKIRVFVNIENGLFRCRVEDDGNGFDWKSLPDPRDYAEDDLKLHGYGLTLVITEFDEVIFNKKGSRIDLVKKLNYCPR